MTKKEFNQLFAELRCIIRDTPELLATISNVDYSALYGCGLFDFIPVIVHPFVVMRMMLDHRYLDGSGFDLDGMTELKACHKSIMLDWNAKYSTIKWEE